MNTLFIDIDLLSAFQVILLGFIGGTLSGFIGSGGAFFMTPGMMNLGVQGVVAVGSNIAHKFGKAMVGSRRHGEMGHVDRKLAAYMVVTALIGIRLAVVVNSRLFKVGAAVADLYISLMFVSILSVVSIFMLRDAMRAAAEDGAGPSRGISEFLSRIDLPPVIHFKVADVRVSLWVLAPVGLATGYMAGTIGVGGFIGVPAMIYIFGAPTVVAAGTELFLAMFMGAFGAVNYAWEGMVDIRLTLLLYLGSLVGIFVGSYGVKVVNEVYIRLVTGLVIIVCAVSRAVAVPMYLRELGMVDFDAAWDAYLNGASEGLLYLAGLGGVSVILYNVFRAHRRRRSIHVIMGDSAG